MRIHHVGYLVKKMDMAVVGFKELGYVLLQDTVLDECRQVWITFLEKDGYVIELVSPATKQSVVAGLLKRQGNTPYHICYETENFDEDLADLMERHYVPAFAEGGIFIDKAPAIDSRKCCFLIHPHLGMIELLEISRK